MADSALYDEAVRPLESVLSSCGTFFNSTTCIGAVRTGWKRREGKAGNNNFLSHTLAS